MIPFLGLLYSTLNIELKNEILHYILVLVFNQVFVAHNTRTKLATCNSKDCDISHGWEILNIANEIN